MKYCFILLSISILFNSCKQNESNIKGTKILKHEVNTTVNQWHQAAAQADFEAYFNLMTSDGVFIGTDAAENWQNNDFRAFSKPYFDKGKAWSFTPLERNVYFNEQQDLAWFDELLQTQMALCRGSGVLKKINNQWKIAHYVLSMAIPNDHSKDVIAIKKQWDSIYTVKNKHNFNLK